MHIIDQPTKYISTVLNSQKLDSGEHYRPLSYVRELDVENGKLIFNELTGEMLLLDLCEFEKYKNSSPIDDELVKDLVKKWFLVPNDMDDALLSQQLVRIFECINKISSFPKIKDFTILPTTDCNARCFYCYELGSRRRSMSISTAKDVVKYIISNKVDGKIRLRWFGGEPLYNSRVIDYISEELKRNDIDFNSTMISNGYLFDAQMVEKAKKVWQLTRIQITLDGTEEIYNRVKAYIYKNDTSPFKRVINNIRQLLESQITVVIRLNMDIHNVDDLFELSSYLIDKLGNYDNIYITPHLLYENENNVRDQANTSYLNKRCAELRRILEERIKFKNEYARILKYRNHCMADTDTSVMILPNGELGKCEHYIDSGFVGNIYDGIVNISQYNAYKRLSTPMTKCDSCEMRPICVYLACCPNVKNKCSPTDKELKQQSLDEYIKYIYKVKHVEKKDENNEI